MERKWVVERLIKPATSILALGGLVTFVAAAWPETGPGPELSADATCSPEANVTLPPPDVNISANFNQIVNGINKTVFFESTKDYIYGLHVGNTLDPKKYISEDKFTEYLTKENVLFEDYAKNYLATNGITVREALKTPKEIQFENKEIQQGMGPNLAILTQLSFMPKGVIDSSGLKNIIIEPENTTGIFDIPRTDGNTLYLSDIDGPYQMASGISKMLLDSCPDKQQILENFTKLTDSSRLRYGEATVKKLNAVRSVREFKKYEETYYMNGYQFENPEALNPENDFISIMSDAILGRNQWSANQANTPAGIKQAIVQKIFNDAVPRGENYELFMTYVSYYGYPDLAPYGVTPTEEASDLQGLFRLLDKTTTKAAYNWEITNYEGQADTLPPPGTPIISDDTLPKPKPTYPKPINFLPYNK